MVNRYAIIAGGVVQNVALAEPAFAGEQGWIEAPPSIGPGWGYAGGVFTPPAPEPEPVPPVVSRFQARAALLGAGKLAEAEAAVAASGDAFVQLAWAEASEWRRDSPTLGALAGAIGMTGAEIDDLFRAAGQITA